MKILFVASRLHLAGIGGGAVYTRSCLGILRSAVGEAGVKVLEVPVPLPAFSHSARQAYAMLRSATSDLPGKCLFLLPSSAEPMLRGELHSWKPDVVVLNGAELLALGKAIPPETAAVLIAHNIESKAMAAMSGRAGAARALLRPFLGRDVVRMKRLEVNGGRAFRNIWCISADIADWFSGLSPEVRTATVPPVFEDTFPVAARPPAERPLHVGLVAKMSWWPNREGADWFLNKVLRNLDEHTILVHYFGPGTEVFSGAHPGLVAHGYLPSLEPAWRDCHFHICPIFSGFGANVKLAEALFHGVPVLATPHAAQSFAGVADDGSIAVRPADSWGAFLRSDDALALAAHQVPDSTRRYFAPGTWTAVAASFLEAAVGTTRGSL